MLAPGAPDAAEAGGGGCICLFGRDHCHHPQATVSSCVIQIFFGWAIAIRWRPPQVGWRPFLLGFLFGATLPLLLLDLAPCLDLATSHPVVSPSSLGLVAPGCRSRAHDAPVARWIKDSELRQGFIRRAATGAVRRARKKGMSSQYPVTLIPYESHKSGCSARGGGVRTAKASSWGTIC